MLSLSLSSSPYLLSTPSTPSLLFFFPVSFSPLQPPSFDPDTTDDPNFYLIRFSRTTGEGVINLNISASEPRERIFIQLAKGTEYIIRIDVVNDAGNGTIFRTIQRQTLIDRKLFLCCPQDWDRYYIR